MLRKISELDIDVEKIIEDFVDGFLYYDSNIKEENLDVVKAVFIDIIKDIINDTDTLEKHCFKLATINIMYDIPFIVLMNKLNHLKKILIEILVENSFSTEVFELCDIYLKIEKYIAKEYLKIYLKKITSSNIIRLNSLNDMIEKKFISYYEDHILWLNALVKSVKELDDNEMPELNSKLCSFGHWLINDAKNVIQNNSKYKNLLKTHEKLHNIGNLINKQFKKECTDYHVLMEYLENCEFISLSIGTELALIDNSIMIKRGTKDELTGTLSRNSLDMIFVNQYEISLATDSCFTLAMCDLDDFKNINDTYGHIAGDKILKEFVSTVKKALRDSDVIIRYGGEEFVIILPNSNSKVAMDKLNQIRLNFENFELNYENNIIKATVSIGHIDIKPPSDIVHEKVTVEHYINLADKKLYEAKHAGKNRVT